MLSDWLQMLCMHVPHDKKACFCVVEFFWGCLSLLSHIARYSLADPQTEEGRERACAERRQREKERDESLDLSLLACEGGDINITEFIRGRNPFSLPLLAHLFFYSSPLVSHITCLSVCHVSILIVSV